MNAQELVQRFPEIPPSLHQEAVLEELASRFSDLLRAAWKPSNCGASQQTAENAVYMKLIAPLTFVSLGLFTPEQIVAKVQALLDEHEADPEQFMAEMIPPDIAASPGGCMGDQPATN